MSAHPIPLQALEAHIAILGKTGSGKTVAAKGAAEGILRRNERFCVIDPTGAWWGMRLKRDGKSAAFSIAIFGGRHADVPIGRESGARLAEIIGRGNVPAIIDTSLMGVGERTHFLTEFGDTLYRANEGSLHLFIDEAHVFAPQGKMRGQERMLHAANNLASGGRSRGFRITMITQRPAKLHKDTLTQAETLVAMRLIAPQDTNAVRAWIGEWADGKRDRDVMSSLPSLARGEGWVWAPEAGLLERVAFPLCDTFDSSSAPKPGDKPIAPRALEREELAELRALLETPAAKGKPAAAAAAPAAAPIDLQAVRKAEYERGLSDGAVAAASDLVAQMTAELHDIANTIQTLTLKFAGLQRSLPEPRHAHRAITIMPPGAGAPARSERPKTDVAAFVGVDRSTKPDRTAVAYRKGGRTVAVGGEGDARLLQIIAAGVSSWEEAALIAGYAPSGGGFRVARKRLIETGAVLEQDGVLFAPGAEPGPIPSAGEIVARWEKKLGGAGARVLRDLFDAGGASTIDAVCARTNYVATGGGFRKGLKQLRSNGLLTQAGSALQLAPVLTARAARR